MKNKMIQPGAILHDVIVGAFKANGYSFEHWCRDRQLSRALARQYTHGQCRGVRGQMMLDEMIDAAGREVVETCYRIRIQQQASDLQAA